MRREFIKMSRTELQINDNSQQFYEISRFPKCIGALDCTHVKKLSPGGEEQEVYRNRKCFLKINVQAICFANLKILFVDGQVLLTIVPYLIIQE